jgi:hypothetical protein
MQYVQKLSTMDFPLSLKKGKVYLTRGHEGPELGAEVQPYSLFNLGARWTWMVNATPQPLNVREGDPVFIVQKAGWAPSL